MLEVQEAGATLLKLLVSLFGLAFKIERPSDDYTWPGIIEGGSRSLMDGIYAQYIINIIGLSN